jgi:alkanesulfonate monooxygenase SsuD/methylene tetrahydromethanopterin reductase-like flavin-dependent oxidoreductase (luciferase family)
MVMRFGLDIPISGKYADPHVLADVAVQAEALGWDGVFVQDVLPLDDEPAIDPWLALAAIAMRTEQVKIGAFLSPLARRRPWQIAKQAVTLDLLSAGRVVFGAALGANEDEFRRFGEEWDPRIRAQKLDEALTVVAGMWTGEPFSFAGRHYSIDRVTSLPRPLQRPRIPVWVAAGWPRRRPLRRAARWDGVYLMDTHQRTGERLSVNDVAAISQYVAEVRTHRSAIDVAVVVDRTTTVARTRTKVDAYSSAGATWWIEDWHGQPPPLG